MIAPLERQVTEEASHSSPMEQPQILDASMLLTDRTGEDHRHSRVLEEVDAVLLEECRPE